MANVAESLSHIFPNSSLGDTWGTNDEHTVTYDEDFSQFDALLNVAIFRLSTSLDSNFCTCDFKGLVLCSRWVHVGEQIVDKIFEDLSIVNNNLGQVEISEGSHENLILATIRVLSLQATSLSED